MDTERKISTAVVTTVKSADIGGLAKQYAEVGLDAVLSEGLLRDIPVVSTIVALGRVGVSINDQIFAKKLVRFLGSLVDLSSEERSSMVERLDKEEGFRHQVGDRLIEILDRVDSHAKPEMVAKVFRAYAVEQIDFDMLSRLNHAIDRLPQYEVRRVREFFSASPAARQTMPVSTLNALMTAGLASQVSGFSALAYQPTSICEAFVSLGLGE